jgi:Spy/CpxP family protein refolding chaperone
MRGFRVWTKRGAAVALLIGATLAAGSALAFRGGHHGRGGMLKYIEHGIGRIDLEPTTRDAVVAVLDRARTEREAMREPMREAHVQMRATLDQDAPSLDAVLAQADAIADLETKAKKSELTAVVEIRKLLTADQWKALRAQHERGKHRRGGDQPDPV